MSDKVFPTDKPAKVSTISRLNKLFVDYFKLMNIFFYPIKVFRSVCNGKYGNGELNITY